jgi:3-keto-disaccharide hydrolase
MKVSVQSFGGFAMTVLRALVFSILVCGALSLVRAAGDWGPARAGVSADAGRQAAPYPGCVKIFNGENFEGWEADPSTWSIVDGAMRGVGGSSRLAFTKADYGSFRLIFTARMNPVNGDHLGVLFWGDRPKDPARPKIDNAGWIQFMPPHGAMWDYHPPQHHNLPHETLASGPRDFTTWYTTELLCNLERGAMRAAVNGIEIARYTHSYAGERSDPEKRIISGPIGMFRHGAGASEYKDIYLEANPKEDKLLTVR